MTPIELDDENVISYVKSIASHLPFDEIQVINAEEVNDQTFVNWIFRVELETRDGNQTVYLRQTRDFVKKKPDIKLDPKRIAFEVTMLQLLNQIIPGITPEVLYFDAPNNVAVLTDIKQDALLLVHELTKGHPHPNTGTYFGHIIAAVHGKTKNISHEKVRGSKDANDAAIAFNRGMRTEVAEKQYPEITKRFLAESDKHNHYLVLGDLASKNIFIDREKVRFLDLERAFIGDPAFDVAFLFCHYLIEVKSEHLPESFQFIESFLVSYKETLRAYLDTSEIADLEKRLIKYLGITILYRLNGFYLAVNAEANKEYWEKKAGELLSYPSNSLMESLQSNL